MKRETVFKLLKGLIDGLVDLNVTGLENVPASGSGLVITSHVSRLDTPFLMVSTPRQDVIPVVAREYQKAPLIGWLLKTLKTIWITRGEYDFAAFREAQDYFKQGWLVGMAPEGHRSRDGVLKEGKSGAVLLAKKAGVMLIPTTVSGSNQMWHWFLRLRKMRVQVAFGPAFYLPEQEEGEDNKSWLKRATDEMMCRIAALLPPRRRGIYANHPRLISLLNEAST
ncbi:MAG: lysophospholipid acyltransferase family protein [Anaerolineaceae bacterium]|jgi:1-acyl-sn-glycerol-3-phosphate acyltransferase